jgi:hypothetical protein
VRGGVSTDGTPLQIFDCHNRPDQRWRFFGPSVNVSFYLDQIAADQMNESGPGNTRDEVYVISRGSISNQILAQERLPRYRSGDDYYEFVTGKLARSSQLSDWTNQDQAPIGRPVLWNGSLEHQQSGEFVILIMEQDNKDWPAIRGGILAGLDAASAVATAAGAGAPITAAIQAAKTLANGFPNNTGSGDVDDVIGAFSVRFTNNDGELQTVWVATPEISIGDEGSRSVTIQDAQNPYAIASRDHGFETAVFNMTGTGGGSYRVAATLELNRTPPLTPWEYLGKTGDGCNAPQPVTVQSSTGSVLVDSQAREVRVNDRRFGWHCASTQEWATCNEGTNLIVATRNRNSINWYCLKETSF